MHVPVDRQALFGLPAADSPDGPLQVLSNFFPGIEPIFTGRPEVERRRIVRTAVHGGTTILILDKVAARGNHVNSS
jgi:hypothetical protein